jgi:acyl-CoA thioesterase-1
MTGFKRLAPLIFAIVVAWLAPMAAARAEPLQIVGFGDSLMAGYGLQPGESFPEKLAVALRARGHDVVIANAGVSGDTTSGGLSRLDWSVPDGTRLVILELGANDMLRGVAPEIARQNLDAMLARLQARSIPVVLAGMLAAPNLGPDYGKAFNGIYPELAEKYGATLYPFFLEGVAASKDLLLDDGLHPNAKGIDAMVAAFLPTMEKALAAVPKPS